MSRHGWKAVERSAAALFGTTRFPANMGGRLDFATRRQAEALSFIGQVKNPKKYSLGQLEAVAKEMETAAGLHHVGVVVIKRSARKPTPHLIVMTETMWRRIAPTLGVGVRPPHQGRAS